MTKQYKYQIKDLRPPAFATLGGQKYLFPGWIPVDDNITFDDVEHINPLQHLKKENFEVTGSTGNKYIVTKHGDTFNCDCPAGKFRGTCKHIKSIKEKHF